MIKQSDPRHQNLHRPNEDPRRRPNEDPRRPERSEGSPGTDSVPCFRDPSLHSGHLKKIMFKIARLPSVDQRWILRQLSHNERNTLNQHNGVKLLQEAQRFRTLKTSDVCILEPNPVEPLPLFCQQLANKAPLYIAIIIEQGAYPWTTLFLEQCDDGTIQSLLDNQVLDVKPAVKQAIFSEWESSISFDRLLDESHG